MLSEGRQLPEVTTLFADQARNLGMITNELSSLERFLSDPDDTKDIQRILVAIADTYLSAVAGQKLASLVSSCLTCLEGGFGDLSLGSNTNRLDKGMNYITAVNDTLSEICI